MDNEISHEDFETIIDEEKKYRELKEKALEWWIIIEVMPKKLVWLRKAKKIGINEAVKRNEIINNSLKWYI